MSFWRRAPRESGIDAGSDAADSPRPRWGRDVVARAFEGETGATLSAAAEALGDQHGTPLTERLVREVRVGDWHASRSAISALRSEKIAGLPAAPAIAAWVLLSHGKVTDEYAAYGIRDALYCLNDFRTLAWNHEHIPGEAGAPWRTLNTVLFDDHLEALARDLVLASYRRLARTAIAYLSMARGDPEAAAAVLCAYLDRTPPASDDADLDYARQEAVAALQKVSGRPRHVPEPADGSRLPAGTHAAEVVAAARAAQASAPAPAPRPPLPPYPDLGLLPAAERPAAQAAFVREHLLPHLCTALETEGVDARMGALQSLYRLGSEAAPAIPALWRVVNDPHLDREPWSRVLVLARQLLANLSSQVQANAAPSPPSAHGIGEEDEEDDASEDGEDGEAGAPTAEPVELILLCTAATDDPAPAVRSQALELLARLPKVPEAAFTAARAALANPEPEVRASALKVLARRLS
jgi:hypothetical protein